jgi:menaquinone-dependent protoporphyrinogen oxidase
MRVLVTAASRHESTHEIAAAIATGLRDRGIDSLAVPVEAVTTLDGFDAVVLGSAVYMGRWLGEARRLAQVHASALCMMPVWLFSSGPVGPADHRIPPGTPADVPVLMRLTRALGHRVFPGRLDMRRLHFAERALARRTIHAPGGDSRDWDAIDRFAGEIAGELLRARRVPVTRADREPAGRPAPGTGKCAASVG